MFKLSLSYGEGVCAHLFELSLNCGEVHVTSCLSWVWVVVRVYVPSS